MDIDLAALPDDVETLQKLARSLATERTSLREAKVEIERLHLIIKKLQRSQFDRRAEQLDNDQLKLGLEDINTDLARVEANLPPPAADAGKPRVQDERPSLPAHLARKDVRLEVEHQACPCCGGALHLIGETTSEMLDHVPARLRVIRICRPRLAVGPAGLAHVLVSKYCDHLTLYRQSQILARKGVELDRSTLANWVGGACWWLEPLQARLAEHVFASQKLSPTIRRSRCSIPDAAAPRPVDCGYTPATTDPGTGPIRQPRSIFTVLIARPSAPLLTWPGKAAP